LSIYVYPFQISRKQVTNIESRISKNKIKITFGIRFNLIYFNYIGIYFILDLYLQFKN